jgi:hypothetical protein
VDVISNSTEFIPWMEWELHLDENVTSIGLWKNETEWGFSVGESQLINKNKQCGA